MDFTDKKVLIMGLGLQGGGVGVTRWFAKQGARVTVTDLKTEKELASSVKDLTDWANLFHLKVNFVLGEHREEDFKNADLVIRNADVPRDSSFLKIARNRGISVEMDESLFLKLCPDLENVIGVTGTRGKTTTTHLIGAILKEAGLSVLLGGNLRGVGTLSLLDEITSQTKIVLELSSWQLQGLDEDRISPHIAVITNLYPDHLNRYKNMEEYAEDKKTIFKYQQKDDFLFLNKDNKYYNGYNFHKGAKAKIVWFTSKDTPLAIRKNFRLAGEHNLENLAAAYRVAKIMGISDMIIERAVKNFKGILFRLQKIGVIDGVTYINDTTSTTPVAAIMAIRAFAGRPIILICGGASKNLEMNELALEVKKSVKAVVLLEGTATNEIIASLKVAKFKSLKGRFNNFEKAIMTAKNEAKPGDIILLSPAAASFGMFINEFDRGEKFNEIFKKSREEN